MGCSCEGCGSMQDPIAQHQKDAKLARMAVRRLNRERLKRSDEENSAALARSNAVILKRAAQSLIRGRDGGLDDGWDTSGRRQASLMCFDEMQVNDPFAAVALKGELHQSSPACAQAGSLHTCKSMNCLRWWPRPTSCATRAIHGRALHWCPWGSSVCLALQATE